MSDREHYKPGRAEGAEVRKQGDEWTLVLQGALESNGQRYWRGDRLSQRAGSVHALTALPGATCLCAVRAMGELDFG